MKLAAIDRWHVVCHETWVLSCGEMIGAGQWNPNMPSDDAPTSSRLPRMSEDAACRYFRFSTIVAAELQMIASQRPDIGRFSQVTERR
jgi:hypothetical protein